MSGKVWELGEGSLALMKEGVALYKQIRGDIRRGVPFWPLGFGSLHDPVLAYGLRAGNRVYLSVFTPGTDHAEIPLSFDGKPVTDVKVIYPSGERCAYSFEQGVLRVDMPQKKAARLFVLTLG